MILGVGVDVVALEGFAAQLADRASSFVAGTFTPRELALIEGRPARDKSPHLGGRYAAKEAFLKAWSMARFGRPPALRGVSLKEIEIVEDAWRRPGVTLHGAVKAAVAESLGDVQVHISLSHDGPVAAAYIILETRSDAQRAEVTHGS